MVGSRFTLASGADRDAHLPRAVYVAAILLLAAAPARTALLLGSAPSGDGVYERLARDISRNAARSGKSRLAVLPFQSMDGQMTPAGRVVAERLTGRVMASGSIEVVERTLLRQVMEEQRLGYVGLVDPKSVQELGRVLGVDALVTGTVLPLKDGSLEINARLIDASNARVLSVGIGKVEMDWSESPFDDFSPWGVRIPPTPAVDWGGFAQGFTGTTLASPGAPVEVPPPSVPRAGFAAMQEWRDSLNAGGLLSCDRAAERADVLQRSIMELKARYWALRLRDRGFSADSLTKNPGSEILDAELRARFYSRLRALHEMPSLAPLTRGETDTLSRREREARRLLETCP